MGRALAYIRVSKERDDMTSPEIQRTAIERHCETHGHVIVSYIEDLDLSGRFWKRRQIEHAVQMIERGEADVLVVWRISRVSRSAKDWAIAVDRVESVGGHIESATEHFDASSTGHLARGLMAQFAEFESRRIGEGWKETGERRIKAGLPHHGRPRFGYSYSKAEGYVQDPVTGPVLRRLYLDYTAGAALTDLAVLSGLHGGPKGVDGLRYALDWGFGAGKIRYREQVFEGAHEGVITEEEFKRYQRARRQRANRQRAEPAEHPFSGILVCWCGQRMWGNSRSVRGVDHTRYLCAVRDETGHTSHTNSISAAKAEAAVLEWLPLFAAELNAEAAGRTGRTRKDPTAASRRSLELALSKNAGRIDGLNEKWVDGDIDKESRDRLLAKYTTEKAALEDRIADLDAKASAPQAAAVVPDLLAHWDHMPSRVKRQMLAALVEKITVRRFGEPERLEFTPK